MVATLEPHRRPIRGAQPHRVVPSPPGIDLTAAEGAVVSLLEAEHLHVTLRGAAARGARTTTSTLAGIVREDSRTRQEFLALAQGRAA